MALEDGINQDRCNSRAEQQRSVQKEIEEEIVRY
jgi:hypothetical protein